MEVLMNQAINHIKLKPEIKVQPITLLDTLKEDEFHLQDKSFLSKFFDTLFEKRDLSLEQWQRIESKPRHAPSSEYAKYFHGGGLK